MFCQSLFFVLMSTPWVLEPDELYYNEPYEPMCEYCEYYVVVQRPQPKRAWTKLQVIDHSAHKTILTVNEPKPRPEPQSARFDEKELH